MATKVGEVFIQVGAVLDEFKKAIKEAEANARGLGKRFDDISKKIEKTAQAMGKAGKQLSKFVTLPIIGLGLAAVKTAADMELLEVGFETMLGSAEKAKDLMKELETFAAATPFQLKNLAQGSKTLLAFGISLESVVPTMRMLGDAAQGNSLKLTSLVRAFGKVQARGKASMEELNILIDAGVPIMDELVKATGVDSVQALIKMSEQGKISSKFVTQAFKNMTGAGGIFFKGMEKASKTTAGLFSTLKDNISLLGADLANIFLPVIKDIIQTVTEWVKSIREMDEGTKGLIARILLFAAAIGPVFIILSKLLLVGKAFVAVTLAMKIGFAGQAVAVGASNAALVANKIAIIAVTVVTKIWNLVLMANPIGIVIGLIAALVGAIILLTKAFGDNTSDAELAEQQQKDLANAIKGVGTSADRTVIAVDKYTQSLSGLPIKEQIKNIKNLLQFEKNRRRGLSVHDEMVKISTDRTRELTKKLHVAERLLIKETTDKRKQANRERFEDRKKATEMWNAFNEESGRTETELLQLDFERQKSILANDLKRRLITKKIAAEAERNLRKELAEDITKIENKQIEERNKNIQTSLTTLAGLVSETGALFQMHFSNRQALVDNQATAEMDKIREVFETQKEAIENSVLTEEQKNEQLAALDEGRARDEKIIQDKADKDKRKIARKAAKSQKATAIIETTIATAVAAMGAFKALAGIPLVGPALGAAAAAAVTILGGVKVALIKATPLPPLQKGGVAKSPALVGEAGAELVFPLESGQGQRALALLSNSLLDAIDMRSKESAPLTTPEASDRMVHVTFNFGDETIFDRITKATSNGQILIDARSIV